MKRLFQLILLFMLMLTSPVHAGGKVFKWVDDSGKVHYGDQPEFMASEVDVPKPFFSSSDDQTDTPDAQNSSDAGANDADAQDKSRGHAATDKDAIAIKKMCDELNDQIKSYESASRLIEKDSKGNRRILSDEDRLKLIADRIKQRDEICTN